MPQQDNTAEIATNHQQAQDQNLNALDNDQNNISLLRSCNMKI